MGELLAEDGQGHRHPRQDGLREGGAYGEAVYEVVNAVTEYDHPGHGGNLVAGVVTERPHVLHGWPGGGVGPVLVAEGSSGGRLTVVVNLVNVLQHPATGPASLLPLQLPFHLHLLLLNYKFLLLGRRDAGETLLVLAGSVLRVVAVRMPVSVDDLPLLPSLGVHEDLQKPLNDEEQIKAGPY